MDGMLLPGMLSEAAVKKNLEGLINAIHILSNVIVNLPVMASCGSFWC